MKLIAHRDHLRRALARAGLAAGGRSLITRTRVHILAESGAAWVTGCGKNGYVRSRVESADVRSGGTAILPADNAVRVMDGWDSKVWTVADGDGETQRLIADPSTGRCCKEYQNKEWVTKWIKNRRGESVQTRVEEDLDPYSFPTCPEFPESHGRQAFHVQADDLFRGLAIAANAQRVSCGDSGKYADGVFLEFAPNRLTLTGFDGGPRACIYGIETLHGNTAGLVVIEAAGAKLLSNAFEGVEGTVEITDDGNHLHARCDGVHVVVPQLIVRTSPPLDVAMSKLPRCSVTLPMVDLHQFLRRLSVPLENLPAIAVPTSSLHLDLSGASLSGVARGVGKAEIDAANASGNHTKARVRLSWAAVKKCVLSLHAGVGMAEITASREQVRIKSGRTTVLLGGCREV